MQTRMADSMARQRFSTIMLGAFSIFALILAAVGVYGVMSYLVTQSRHDIGLRIALGALPSQVLSLILGQGLIMVSAGLLVGIVVAL